MSRLGLNPSWLQSCCIPCYPVYIEALEPSLIDRLLILDLPFDRSRVICFDLSSSQQYIVSPQNSSLIVTMPKLSIFNFLSLPHEPLVRHLTNHIHGGNTTSRSLEWDYTDIRRVESWDIFCLETLRDRFGPLFDLNILSASLVGVIPDNYLNIRSEHQLEILFHMTIFTRVNIALQSVNIHLDQRPHLLGVFGKVSDRQVISPGLQYGGLVNQISLSISALITVNFIQLPSAISNFLQNGLMIVGSLRL